LGKGIREFKDAIRGAGDVKPDVEKWRGRSGRLQHHFPIVSRSRRDLLPAEGMIVDVLPP
jgi:hypothetical protein